MASITEILYILLFFLLQNCLYHAEPVQYCKFGNSDEVDFCMGLTMHQNLTTNSHDLYLSMTHTRYGGYNTGWTAIGAGSSMAGSLMFIIYGDPLGSEPPFVSIRGSTGHSQPQLITREASGGLDIRVLRSSWMPVTGSFTPDSPSYTARVFLVCYSCHLWPGIQIDANSPSQPWIWAWNKAQAFSVYNYDTELQMHKHHAGAGGWGNFYVDMAKSINTAPNPPSVPPIRPEVAALGTSDMPMHGKGGIRNILKRVLNPVWHLHGLLMGVAFLLLFPAGIIAMRSGSAKSFKYHWVLQLLASLLTGLGVITGLLLTEGISTVHQAQGLAIGTSICIQSVLGWRHHVGFLKIHQRTWISHGHIWLGRAIILAGWSNLVTGLWLRGYPGSCLVIMVTVVSMEVIGLIYLSG